MAPDKKPNIVFILTDNFGLRGVGRRGFAQAQFSSAFIPFLRQRLNLGLDQESGPIQSI
jgi:hypothetical protein